MHIIRKKYRVEMAHQLASACTGACHETIHGHSYVVELLLTGPLNDDNMVRDFGSLQYFKDWLMEYFDHALIMPSTLDLDYLTMLGHFNKKMRLVNVNPTAEWMAEFIFKEAGAILRDSVKVAEVIVHETETGYASYKE